MIKKRKFLGILVLTLLFCLLNSTQLQAQEEPGGFDFVRVGDDGTMSGPSGLLGTDEDDEGLTGTPNDPLRPFRFHNAIMASDDLDAQIQEELDAYAEAEGITIVYWEIYTGDDNAYFNFDEHVWRWEKRASWVKIFYL